MKTKFVLGFFGILLAGVCASADQHSAPDDVNVRDPRLLEGRLFTVEVKPVGRELEMKIAGKQLAQLQWDQLGMTAEFHVGDKVFRALPRRRVGVFAIDRSKVPADADSLHLKVNYKGESENFQYKLPRP